MSIPGTLHVLGQSEVQTPQMTSGIFHLICACLLTKIPFGVHIQKHFLTSYSIYAFFVDPLGSYKILPATLSHSEHAKKY